MGGTGNDPLSPKILRMRWLKSPKGERNFGGEREKRGERGGKAGMRSPKVLRGVKDWISLIGAGAMRRRCDCLWARECLGKRRDGLGA